MARCAVRRTTLRALTSTVIVVVPCKSWHRCRLRPGHRRPDERPGIDRLGSLSAARQGCQPGPQGKCGTVTVPLDYRHPNGKAITVEVSKIATAKPGEKRGDLLLNPGGPALEGLDMPAAMAPTLPASVLDEYDLIGFDPRGVGHSNPMSCGLPDPSLADAFSYPAADGSIQHNIAAARATARVWHQQTMLWNQGMNDRFPDAARIAAADNAGLGLGSTTAQVTSTFLTLASHLDRTPAAVPGTKLPLTGALVRAVTYELLLHNGTLTPLAQFWKAAADLSAHRTPTAADTAVLREVFADAPAEPGVPADNQVSMFMTLVCGDVSWPHAVAAYAAATAAARAKYPLSDGMPDNIWPCAFWSKAPVEPPVQVTSHGPRDILILQNRRDNATPWEGALGMAKALGPRAGFVGADNGGHYVYGTGSACADQATIAFLTKGNLPAKPLYCSGPNP
jgi:pimeloyl-ACP methyl ester carboxylesterase